MMTASRCVGQFWWTGWNAHLRYSDVPIWQWRRVQSGHLDAWQFPHVLCRGGRDYRSTPRWFFTYTINTGAVAGDAGAFATDPHTLSPMDNISLGTAWLFSQFHAGTLTLDNGTGSYFDANRSANAGELQLAIWYLEDESGGVDNGYVTLAETALGLTESQIKADASGAYGVVALNLFNMDGAAQDQLAVVPESGHDSLYGNGRSAPDWKHGQVAADCGMKSPEDIKTTINHARANQHHQPVDSNLEYGVRVGTPFDLHLLCRHPGSQTGCRKNSPANQSEATVGSNPEASLSVIHH